MFRLLETQPVCSNFFGDRPALRRFPTQRQKTARHRMLGIRSHAESMDRRNLHEPKLGQSLIDVLGGVGDRL